MCTLIAIVVSLVVAVLFAGLWQVHPALAYISCLALTSIGCIPRRRWRLHRFDDILDPGVVSGVALVISLFAFWQIWVAVGVAVAVLVAFMIQPIRDEGFKYFVVDAYPGIVSVVLTAGILLATVSYLIVHRHAPA